MVGKHAREIGESDTGLQQSLRLRLHQWVARLDGEISRTSFLQCDSRFHGADGLCSGQVLIGLQEIKIADFIGRTNLVQDDG